jgi:hypothetical protein
MGLVTGGKLNILLNPLLEGSVSMLGAPTERIAVVASVN